ncbi:GNAT family N-acetyltransferase [Nicoliella lavandulae]|uniref:GNAT family N-acetyltransferase n=1 Tax=Nicoliella lavandulae TaxID=3082954 RepID=A0ABU8SK25_9LACO
MATTYVRIAQESDLTSIMNIINEAKALLKADGSNQWQAGYPNASTISTDIIKKNSYVLIIDGKIAGTACLTSEPEPNYSEIDGSWQHPDEPYQVIHRIAISGQYRGMHLGSFFLSNLITISSISGFKNIRFDTRPINTRMQYLGTNFGFKYCGIIHDAFDVTQPQYAYELKL